MAKISLGNIGSLIDATTAQTSLNSNFSTIGSTFDRVLFLDGTAPNQMQNTFDMNSFHLINLPQPATDHEPLRFSDLNSFIGGGTITNIPVGGLAGNILKKNTNADYDVGWGTLAASLSAGSNISLTGSTIVTISTLQNPSFTTSVSTPSLILNGTTLGSVTGTGAIVLATSPTIATATLSSPTMTAPILGAATATTINKVTITQPATAATLTIANNKTLTANNSLTLAGTDATTLTFPTTSDTIPGLAQSNAWTNSNVFNNTGGARIKGSSTGTIFLATANAGASDFTATFPAATGTVALTSGVVSSFNTLTGAVTTNVTKQVFTSSGTYTPTANMAHCIIECWGAGGGGGGVGASGAGNQGAGAGGGAGGYSRAYKTLAQVQADASFSAGHVSITIGAAGTGGTTAPTNGGAGGNTSVGTSLCIANGGAGGGNGGVGGGNGQGGAGGTAGTGDVTGTGQAGTSSLGGAGFVTIGFSIGCGGSSSVGGGGAAPQITGAGGFNGIAGTGFGSGGSGGASYNTAGGTASGGAGTAGLIIITEFINV